MRKRLILLFIALFAGMLLTGCASSLRAHFSAALFTSTTIPIGYSAPDNNVDYELIGEVLGKSSSMNVLGIFASGDAGLYAAYQDALGHAPGANRLVDVIVDQSNSSFLVLFASQTTVIHATAVKTKSRAYSPTRQQSESTFMDNNIESKESKQIQPSKATPINVDKQSLTAWKKDLLLQLNNSASAQKGWRSYLRFIKKMIEPEEWVEGLAEKDYIQYKKSNLSVEKWMLKRWNDEQY
jgi:hypothetical protein